MASQSTRAGTQSRALSPRCELPFQMRSAVCPAGQSPYGRLIPCQFVQELVELGMDVSPIRQIDNGGGLTAGAEVVDGM